MRGGLCSQGQHLPCFFGSFLGASVEGRGFLLGEQKKNRAPGRGEQSGWDWQGNHAERGCRDCIPDSVLKARKGVG
jgi:hypothetical protein